MTKIIRVDCCNMCPYVQFNLRMELIYCCVKRSDPTVPRTIEEEIFIETVPDWCPLEDGDKT